VTETVQVAILSRALARGDIVGRDDVLIDRLPRRQVGTIRPADPDQIVGMAARRALRAGQPVAQSDFTRPTLVKAGDGVLLVFETNGLSVTGRGEAQESGTKGDLVRVVNPQSKRTVVGTVAGPGRVVVSAAQTTQAALAGSNTGRTTP
jgi:flagella basal body P-ring formation protein FlgA